MSNYTAGYFVGSLSTSSINRLLAKALVRLAPPELDLTEIALKDLPLYNRDHDDDYPPVATAFKDAIAAVDAVLFVTPEYNRSIPGVLKTRSTGRVGRTARTRLRVVGTWPDDLALADAPTLVRELAARGLWLEQEALAVDPPTGAALEAML